MARLRSRLRLGVRGKLLALLAGTALLALLLACASFVYYDRTSTAAAKQRTIGVLTRSVAQSAFGPTAFGDPDSARVILEVLAAEPTARAGAIYGTDGARLASWERSPRDALPTARPTLADGIHGGRLAPLYPEREFPFMSVLRIDADFLAGCFYGSASEEERAAFVKTQKETLEDYVPIYRTADHFTAEDLDYLVNEVYAAHGKRFKGEKWQKYFGEKTWYKPIADDVEGQLSAIERSNIAFVRDVQSKVRQSEASYTHAEFSLGMYYR